MYSTCGVFPVPPVEMFPTEISGISKDFDLNKPQSKHLFRNQTTVPYSREKGRQKHFY